MLINWIRHTKPESVFCILEMFEYIITFWICVLVLWIHKGYCVVKKLVWNVCIKAFWYTKSFYYLFIEARIRFKRNFILFSFSVKGKKTVQRPSSLNTPSLNGRGFSPLLNSSETSSKWLRETAGSRGPSPVIQQSIDPPHYGVPKNIPVTSTQGNRSSTLWSS